MPIRAVERLCVVLLLGLWTAHLAAQQADPWVDWSTADSAHFRVHYRSVQRAQAEAVAAAAERAYPKVTTLLHWQPRSRTEVLVYSESDVANGFTTPLPYNLIGVFLAPPLEGELLDNSAWLDLLLVHEFTHAVQLDEARGVPGVLQRIFGRNPLLVPNLLAPGWMLEGLAVYAESDPANGRGRLDGPWFEAWLRAQRAQGFLSLSELNANGRALPTSKQYLYGAYFYDFLVRRYGAEAVPALVSRYTAAMWWCRGSHPPRAASAANRWAACGPIFWPIWNVASIKVTTRC